MVVNQINGAKDANKKRIKKKDEIKTPIGKSKKSIQKKQNFIKSDLILKILKYIILVSIIVITFYPPFLRGLFFEKEQLFTEVFTFVVFILFWVYKIIIRDKKFLQTPIDYAAFGFIIVYFISLFAAASLHLAFMEWLKYCMYFAIFLMISDLINTFKKKTFIISAIVISAVGVCIIGLDSIIKGNIVKILNSLFNTLGVTKSLGLKEMFFQLTDGSRIYSTFQYPNAFAAYLMAAFILSVSLTLISQKLYSRALFGAASTIILVTFILTLSRGAYLILPVALLLLIISLPKEIRIKGIMGLIFIAIPSAASSALILREKAANSTAGLKLWVILLAGVVITIVFIQLLELISDRLSKISWKVYSAIAISFILLAFSAAFYMLRASQSLELSHSIEQQDGAIVVQKSAILKPDSEYEVAFSVEAFMNSDKPDAYSISVSSRSEKNILFGGETPITYFSDKASSGMVEKKIKFKVPGDSKVVDIRFMNTYQGTRAIFNNARIINASTGKVEKNIILKYKYLPEAISARWENVGADVSKITRQNFYKDGMKIFRDHWLIGAGGGAWSVLYFSYQSYLYWSTEAHNFFLQLALETGILGVILVLLLIFSIVAAQLIDLFGKRQGEVRERVLKATLFASIAGLLMHSAIDFDFSLAAITLLLWELIALFNTGSRQSGKEHASECKDNYRNMLAAKLEGIVNVKRIGIYPALGLAISLILFIAPAMALSARAYAAKIPDIIQNDGVEAAINDAKNAAELYPFRPEYKIDYANLILKKGKLTQQELNEANKQISSAEKLCKYNADILAKIGAYYLSTGNIEKGLKTFDGIIKVKPFDSGTWETRIDAYSKVIAYFIDKNEIAKAYSYIGSVDKIIDEAKNINKGNLNPFVFSETKTYRTLEFYKYIRETIDYKNDKNINRDILNDIYNKIIFTNYLQLDVNSDGIPDQWSLPDPVNTKLSLENGVMVLDCSKTGYGNIVSRKLSLEAGKKYKIEVELSNPGQVEKIDYNLTGVQTGVLLLSGSAYIADISTSSDLKPADNVLWLGMPGKVSIKNVRIYEV